MSAIESNISANQFVSQVNNAIEGLNISTDDSSADVIDALNEAFDGVEGRRVITDKYAGGFIEDVNYNIDLMDSGGGDEPIVDEKITLPQVPRLLFIGNSLTLDSVSYLPFILKAHGFDAIIGISFRHGKTVEWYDSIYNTPSASNSTANDCYLYVCDTRETNPIWHDFGNKYDSISQEWCFRCPRQAIFATNADVDGFMDDPNVIELTGKWDLISIQSFGTESNSGSSLDTTYPSLVSSLVTDNAPQDFALGFTMPANTPSQSPVGIINKTNSFVSGNNSNSGRKKIDIVFPFGTAMANARAHREMRSMVTEAEASVNYSASSFFSGRQLFGDNLHSNEGLPCYIAALSIAKSLFSKVSNYDGADITGSEILPSVNGVYPSGSDWSAWSVAAQIRNPNGQNTIFGIDGANGSIVRNGTIGNISRQWAVWFANQAVLNPYAIVNSRKDGASTDSNITIHATNCSVVVGTINSSGTGTPPSTYPFFSTNVLWLWVIPNTGYTITEAYWTTDWRVEENIVDDFKVNFTTVNEKRKFGFNGLHDDIVIYATATQNE